MEDKVTTIWKNFNQQLRDSICTKMNNRVECLDVLQDVYIKIIRNIDKIEKVENTPSYLMAIANNAVTDHYRRQSNKPILQGDGIDDLVIIDEVAGEEDMINNCCIQCLEPGIDTLPDLYKEAFVLSEVQGMPQKDVAEKLGITLSGAKSRVQRARQKLREEVLKCCYNRDL